MTRARLGVIHETDTSLFATSTARRRRRRGLALALLIAVAGIGASLALGWLLAKEEQTLLEAKFHSHAGRRIGVIYRDLKDRLGTAGTLAAFFEGSGVVERDEFQTFTAPIQERHPSIEILAWAPRVDARRRAVHEKSARAKGLTNYRIHQHDDREALAPAGQGDVCYPLLFVEPAKKYKSLIGFDLASNAACRSAIERALAKRQTTVAVAPLPDHDGTEPLLLYTFEPARDGDTRTAQSPGARAASNGVVVVVSRIDALVEAALNVFAPVGIDFYITTPDGQPIYMRPSPLHGDHAPIIPGQPPPRVGGMDPMIAHIDLAGSHWTMTCIPMNSYLAWQRTWGPAGAVLAGLMITALAVGYTLLLTGRTVRVEQLVFRRTRELAESEQRFRRLVENAGDAFFLRNEQGNFLDVNKQACDSLGYTREELLSMNVRDVDVRYVAENFLRYSEYPADQYPVTIEGCHRRKDGVTFPVEVRLAALDTEDGRLMLALVRDITDRKRAEVELHQEQRRLREMLDEHERDRKLVAYEIHDGLAQQLAGALYRFDSVPRLLDGDPAVVRKMFESAVQLLRDAMTETRRLISGLRPPVLDESGVVAAVESLISERQGQGGPEIEFVHDPRFDRLPPPLESAVFRIVQECLTNACRYSHSGKVRIELDRTDGRVRIDVQDWGVGFNPAEVHGEHFGLQGISERARLLGGEAIIEAAVQQGVHIVVDVPLSPRDEAATPESL